MLRESTGRILGALRVLNISWILSLCPLTLPLLCLVRGIFAPLLRVRSISCVTLKLLGEGAHSTRPINAPFQILECNHHGFVETVRVPFMDGGLQHITYFETVFGQLHGIFIVDQLILVRFSVRVQRRTQNGVLTRTRARVVLTVLKTSFAEGASTAFLFKISILSSRSDVLAFRVRVAIFVDLALLSGMAVVE